MTSEVDFPAVRAAMAAREPAFKAGWTASYQYNRLHEPTPEQRREYRRACQASDDAYDRVVAAYAAELLPAVLGHEWAPTTRSLYATAFHQRLALYRQQSYVAGDCTPLFDHPLHFRRRGAKGKLTWRNCALIGQPYNMRPGEPLPSDAITGAMALAEQYGVGVWVRHDLSAWYPGRTALVVAALGLDPADAPRFGFMAIRRPGAMQQAA